MDNLQRKKKSLPYHYDDPKIMQNQTEYEELLYDYNQLRPSAESDKEKLLQQMFAEIGPDCHIEAPLRSTWGCHNTHFGKGIYANSGLCLIDDTDIYIGNDCMIGPNVVISTSGHPILPILRTNNYVYNFPVYIGNNVWIGSSVQILPGVNIGDNSVIGAGSVVTHDVSDNTVAYGVPCKEVRKIGEQDKKYYFKKYQLDVDR